MEFWCCSISNVTDFYFFMLVFSSSVHCSIADKYENNVCLALKNESEGKLVKNIAKKFLKGLITILHSIRVEIHWFTFYILKTKPKSVWMLISNSYRKYLYNVTIVLIL